MFCLCICITTELFNCVFVVTRCLWKPPFYWETILSKANFYPSIHLRCMASGAVHPFRLGVPTVLGCICTCWVKTLVWPCCKFFCNCHFFNWGILVSVNLSNQGASPTQQNNFNYNWCEHQGPLACSVPCQEHISEPANERINEECYSLTNNKDYASLNNVWTGTNGLSRDVKEKVAE